MSFSDRDSEENPVNLNTVRINLVSTRVSTIGVKRRRNTRQPSRRTSIGTRIRCVSATGSHLMRDKHYLVERVSGRLHELRRDRPGRQYSP